MRVQINWKEADFAVTVASRSGDFHASIESLRNILNILLDEW